MAPRLKRVVSASWVCLKLEREVDGNELFLQIQDAFTGDQTGFEFLSIKGLGQIFIRSSLHGLDQILFAVFSRQEHDVHIFAGRIFS